MRVTLTWAEAAVAAQHGIRRHLASLELGLTPNAGTPEKDHWRSHIEGVAGEMAFAKATGKYCPFTLNTFKAEADVDKFYEVRTRSRDDFELYVRDTDHEERPYILLRGTLPTYDLVGWIWGYDARQVAWWKNHGGYGFAWFVPDKALRPMETLPSRDAAPEIVDTPF
jgi:hypothetical protein